MSSTLPPRETMWRIVAEVRAGSTVGAAIARHGYSHGAIDRWRRVVPGFAADLDHAKRVGHPTREMKRRFLELLAGGLSSRDAAAALGKGRSCPCNWSTRDPEFAREYRRLIGPCRYARKTRELEAMLDLLARGESLDTVLSTVDLHPKTVYEWRRLRTPQWAMIERAMRAGAAAREGRAA